MKRFSPALLPAALLSFVSPLWSQEAPGPLPRGERLISEFNCTACHETEATVLDRLRPQLAPRLNDVASRVTPGYLERYLTDPAGHNPMGRMPDQLADMSPKERQWAAKVLTHFLMDLGEPMDRTPTGAHLSSVERGRRIFHETGCVACHRPQEELWELDWTLAELFAESESDEGEDEEAPEEEEAEVFLPEGTLAHPDVPLELDWIAGKTTVEALTEFLMDPVAVRPSGRMPDLGLTENEARDVARYLLRGQTSLGEWRYEEAPGLNREYFEEDFNKGAQWDTYSAKRTEAAFDFKIDRRDRDEHFGFRWNGMINVPKTGRYTFWTTSDDGSNLWVDGEHVVDNGGIHGTKTASGSIDLDEGRHAILVTFFEAGGGENMKVEWSGPEFERSSIPGDVMSHAGLVHRPDPTEFTLDRDMAAEGQELFGSLGCMACHTTGIESLERRTSGSAGPLLKDLHGQAPTGCLEGSARNRIRFDAEGDLAAVKSALANVASWTQPLEPKLAVSRELDRLNCYACHRRGDLGGTHPIVKDYFLADESAELGDEGRIPPHLSQVGGKLHREWLEKVLVGEGRARPYMHTRMPSFGEGNVGHLTDLFVAADPAYPDDKDWDVSPDILAMGHELVGKGALGCVQCHTFAGQRSLGVQAVDMTTMVDRIQYGWFRELMLDPKSLNMNTRMPSFWPDGESPSPLLDGKPEAQIEAVWAFLSLGEGMATPAGLSTPDDAYKLVPTDGPVTAGVFMKDVSPRTLVVGFPERAHYAFDMQGSRVAKIWRGDFFNTRGTWHGRAGALENPPSADVLEMPGGAPFARLADRTDAWPSAAPVPLGRRFDKDRVPVQRYRIGEVVVEERLVPELRFGGSVMRREFRLTSRVPIRDLYFRPYAWGSGAENWSAPKTLDGGGLRYDALSPAVTLDFVGIGAPTVVRGDGVDLLAPVVFEPVEGGFEATFSVEVSW